MVDKAEKTIKALRNYAAASHEKRRAIEEKIAKTYGSESLESTISNNSIGPILDKAFWARDTEEVTYDLIGSAIVRLDSGHLKMGVISKAEAFPKPPSKYKERLAPFYSQQPGTIWVYEGQRGNFVTIAAHQKDKMGVVRIGEIATPKEKIKTTDVWKYLSLSPLEEFQNRPVNSSVLYIARPHFELVSAKIEPRKIAPAGKDVFTVGYSL